MQLSKSEEQLMEIIWTYEKVFMKDLLDKHPLPTPATTTVSTLLKRMQDKGFVGYNTLGNSREYYALVKKEAYFKKQMKGIVKDYFGNSPLRFASFFTTTANLNRSELEALKDIIDQQIKQTKK